MLIKYNNNHINIIIHYIIMNILSIDVGIKNLAYCLFEIKNDIEYSIIKWNVINLVSDQKYVCGVKKKNGDNCTFAAKYCKNNEYYCKKHAKASDKYIIGNTDLNPIKYKRLPCYKLKPLVLNQGIELDENIKYNKTQLIELLNTFVENKCLDIVSVKKCSNVNLVMLGRSICKNFDKEFEGINIDCVIIENQISPLANKMKTIQGMIAQYFIMNNTKTIEFISAINKLKQWVKKKTTYNERKKLGITISIDLINQNNQFKPWDKHFIDHKKKDDLADAFLQGIWYIQDNDLIKLKNTIKII